MDRGRVTTSRRIRTLIVDDHPAVRRGLALLLMSEGVDVCAEATGRVDALSRLKERYPDLAIVDLSLDHEDGLGLVADLRERKVHVLVYSMHSDPRRVSGAISAGALGYVSKREVEGVLVQAIREVAAGRRFLSPAAAASLAESVARSQSDDAVQKLSPHERSVYDLLGQGADTFEIADALQITNHTVDSYYGRILQKLELGGMHELRRHAIEYCRKHAP